MRGTIVGIIDGLNEVLVKFKDVQEFLKDQVVDVEIVGIKKTNTANSYYWALNKALTHELRKDDPELTYIEVYRRHIAEMRVYVEVPIKHERVKKYERVWVGKHIGRFIETRESIDYPGYDIVTAYYGSSDFDKEEMSILIANCIQDCKQYDIPIYSQEEVNRLVEEWGKMYQA